MDYVAKVILFYVIGVAMGWLLANILQYCVRMDGSRALASTIAFAMVWLLTIILHNYVIRMDDSAIIGNAMGYMLEVILRNLLVRLCHEYKNPLLIQAPVQASPQVQASNVQFLRVQASYVRSLDLQARLQAYIHGQDVDLHQHPELLELCLEVDALCHELHKECHQIQASC